MAEVELSLVEDESADQTYPLTEDEKRELARVQRAQDEVAMRRAAATSGKGGAPAAVDTNRPRQFIKPGTPLALGPVVNDAPFHPSPSLHEGRIEALPNYENPDVKGFVQPALQALSNVRVTLEAVDAAHQALRKDTSKTPEQKLLLVATAAQKKYDAVFANLASTETTLRKAIDHTEKELSTPLTSAATTDAHKELRIVLRGMDKTERHKAIQHAIDNGDDTVVSAVLGAHPMATLVDPVFHQTWTRRVNEKRNPGLVMRLDAQRKALDIMVSIIPLIEPQFEKAMRGSFSRAKAVQGLSDASEAALKKILGQE